MEWTWGGFLIKWSWGYLYWNKMMMEAIKDKQARGELRSSHAKLSAQLQKKKKKSRGALRGRWSEVTWEGNEMGQSVGKGFDGCWFLFLYLGHEYIFGLRVLWNLYPLERFSSISSPKTHHKTPSFSRITFYSIYFQLALDCELMLPFLVYTGTVVNVHFMVIRMSFCTGHWSDLYIGLG